MKSLNLRFLLFESYPIKDKMSNMNDIESLLNQFPFTMNINIEWGDMDAARHVNNVTYMRFAESARIRFMDQFEWGWSTDDGDGVILAWQDCKYIFPVTYPDTLTIGAKVSEIRHDRFFIQCQMFSQKHQRLVAITNHSHVPYSYQTLQKIPLPKQWLQALEAFRVV